MADQEEVDYCKTCYHKAVDHYGAIDRGIFPCSIDGCPCGDYIHGETRVTSPTGGSKGTKAERFDLIPVYPLTQLSRLYAFGVKKYAAHNWRKGYDWSKSYASAMRHMTQFWNGEDIDPETGIPHVICATFHMFALAQFMQDFPQYDDRYVNKEDD